MSHSFPSAGFFQALQRRVEAEAPRFHKQGSCDCTFGLRVLPASGKDQARLYVLRFDVFSLADVHEAPPDAVPVAVDFVLEAPEPVWREMLCSLGKQGEIDGAHTINSLTHFDHPMRVVAPDPAGQDKLFRFQESIQLLFNVAAQLAAEDGARGWGAARW